MTHNSVFLQQAIGTQGANAEWDKALLAYVSAFTRCTADSEFGPHAIAYEAFLDVRASLEATHGKDFLKSPDAAEINRIEYAKVQADEERMHKEHYSPMWKAARDLAKTPAPNLAAAAFKLTLIQREDLDNDKHMDREPMEIVEADFARLQGK